MTVEKVTVIGAGTMGHGIAHVAAACGMDAVLHDVNPEILQKGLGAITANLAKGVEKGKVTPEARDQTLSHVHGEETLEAAVEDAHLVVEAVPENLDLKKQIFKTLEPLVSTETLLATNTSSLPIGEIAEAVEHPERVVGMHFFNPVHIMALLEVVRGAATSEATIGAAVDAGVRMGKECIVVKDAPGFATSRLGVVLGLEAMRMFEQEVASAEDIDKAMTLGYRHPIGPLRLTDLVGLDVRLAIAEHLHRALGSSAFEPPRVLREMVENGKLGKKSGEGFYTWS